MRLSIYFLRYIEYIEIYPPVQVSGYELSDD
jgi:hypothetical protein